MVLVNAIQCAVSSPSYCFVPRTRASLLINSSGLINRSRDTSSGHPCRPHGSLFCLCSSPVRISLCNPSRGPPRGLRTVVVQVCSTSSETADSVLRRTSLLSSRRYLHDHRRANFISRLFASRCFPSALSPCQRIGCEALRC